MNPTHTLPRAFYGSIILTSLLYLFITVTVISVEPLQHIADIKETVLAEAARPLLGDTGYRLIAIAAMFSTLAAITVTLYGINRLGHELARERELPAFMLATSGWKPLLLRLLLFSSVAIVLANTLDINTTAILASGLFLLVFGVVNAAALELAEPIGANRWLPLLGALSAFFALTALLLFAMHSLPNAALVLLDTLLAALMYRTLYRIYASKTSR
ncbi:MAG: amino acid permease [Candidatus Thiothrix putei]|uniref:Amino acid permease n=1 Tax=Candidatus Thiothrix putei TaxID=3080811 RepID=A0AA95KT09_9GAMM|nr:MAG: amino acid permease [Candidatus Thiothrix putei]